MAAGRLRCIFHFKFLFQHFFLKWLQLCVLLCLSHSVESQEVIDAELAARVLRLVNVADSGLHSQVNHQITRILICGLISLNCILNWCLKKQPVILVVCLWRVLGKWFKWEWSEFWAVWLVCRTIESFFSMLKSTLILELMRTIVDS